MKLFFKNYIAEEEQGRFNLYKDVDMIATRDTPNYEKGEEYVDKQLIGYGYTFERLMRRMAEDIVAQSDVTTLRGYIDEFNKVIDSINLTE